MNVHKNVERVDSILNGAYNSAFRVAFILAATSIIRNIFRIRNS